MYIFINVFVLAPLLQVGFAFNDEETDLMSLSLNYDDGVDDIENPEIWNDRTQYVVFEDMSKTLLEQICKDPNKMIYVKQEDVTIDCNNFISEANPVEENHDIIKRSLDDNVEGSGQTETEPPISDDKSEKTQGTEENPKETEETPIRTEETEEKPEETEEKPEETTEKPEETTETPEQTEETEKTPEANEKQQGTENSSGDVTITTQATTTVKETIKSENKSAQQETTPTVTTVKTTTPQPVTTEIKKEVETYQPTTTTKPESEIPKTEAPKGIETMKMNEINSKEPEETEKNEDKSVEADHRDPKKDAEKVKGRTLHGSKKNEEIKEDSEDPVRTKESTEGTKQAGSKDTTILVILFVAVVVVGALAFGYNFIKKRKRQNEDLERVERASIKRSLQNLTRTENEVEKNPLLDGKKEVEMVDMKKSAVENGEKPTVKS